MQTPHTGGLEFNNLLIVANHCITVLPTIVSSAFINVFCQEFRLLESNNLTELLPLPLGTFFNFITLPQMQCLFNTQQNASMIMFRYGTKLIYCKHLLFSFLSAVIFSKD